MGEPVELPLEDEWGRIHGTLELRLQGKTDFSGERYPLLDLRRDADRDESMPPVQLMEAHEYYFELHLEDVEGTVRSDKPEFFDFNPDERTGRLRPGLHTGTLTVAFSADGKKLGRVSLEVRSLKLDYREHYRWMLRDLADSMAEVVMQRFAPTEQAFRPDMSRDPMTLYQRFAFLKSLLLDESFQAALQQVLHRPHIAWVTEREHRRPGRGTRGSSRLARELSKPGPRIEWAGAPSGHLTTLPRRVQSARTESTLDSPPNRFVKFALLRWRGVVARIADALEAARSNMPVERGIAECRSLLDRLDALLGRELFREVGTLSHFPAGSQVLQKRAGYRDIFRAYMQFEVASQLCWSGGEDVYSAGQRDVAALYEYWVFLEVAQTVSEMCHVPFDFGSLLEVDKGELNLVLKRGRTQVLSGNVQRLGRSLGLELYFNPTFSGTEGRRQSWTRQMRPDVSLRLFPERGADEEEDIWLHFDAKYRIEHLSQLLGPEEDDDEDEATATDISPKRADLLKMHAYRDAIRRSAGAYVIYPGYRGGDERGLEYQEYHEILPGLGAFPLRPAPQLGSAPEGKGALAGFIDRVLNHMSSRLTRHERGRFWTREAFDEDEHTRATPAALLESKPPADTMVLLGYVKNRDQLAWVLEHGLYNVRADERHGQVLPGSPVLAADVILLYGKELDAIQMWRVSGDPRVVTKSRMREMGYPDPGSDVYFCFSIDEEVSHRWPEFANWTVRDARAVWNERFDLEHVGTPAATSALDLLNTRSDLQSD